MEVGSVAVSAGAGGGVLQRSSSGSEAAPQVGHMDAVYPEPLSRLHAQQHLLYRRAVRKNKGRRGPASARYRTQPVTFSEIQEVDEESLDESMLAEQSAGGKTGSSTNSRSEQDLKAHFSEFLRLQKQASASANKDEPTSPCTPDGEPSTSRQPRPPCV